MNLKLRRVQDLCATFVPSAQTMMLKAWYVLTAYVPRRLPRTHDELEKFRKIAEKYYGIECGAHEWITICGHITSTPGDRIRKSYGRILNAARRLSVNRVAQEQKQVATKILNDRLKELAAEEAKNAPEQSTEPQSVS